MLTKSAPASARGTMLGRLDAAGSLCRVVLPACVGTLCDRRGLWAAFALQAALCIAGALVVELWSVGRGVGGAAADAEAMAEARAASQKKHD